MKIRRVLVVYKKSALELYSGGGRDRRFLRLIRSDHFSTRRFRPGHENHANALSEVRRILKGRNLDAVFVYRARAFSDRGFDLVLTVGGDGTFLDAAHRVCRVPMLGLNSNPADSVGLFCGATSANLDGVLDAIGEGRCRSVEMTRLRVRIGREVLPLPVLNDVLIAHADPAATSKFVLETGGTRGDFKSSGIWVGPAAGSTAAIASAGGRVLPIGSRRFQFVVREPYLPEGKSPGPVRGVLASEDRLVLHSNMRNGRVYVDGSHRDYGFPLGERVEISTRAPRLTVFAFDRARRGELFR
jgi:NAD+ kinase